MRVGPWSEHPLDVGDGDLATLGAVPRMIVAAVVRPEQDLQHGVDVGAVRCGNTAQLVPDRRDQHSAEVEHHRLERPAARIAVPSALGRGNHGDQSKEADGTCSGEYTGAVASMRCLRLTAPLRPPSPSIVRMSK